MAIMKAHQTSSYKVYATICVCYAHPTNAHGKRTSFIYKQLENSSHVFLSTDTTKRSLQPPYSGPYEVISRINNKLYIIRVNGKENISTERLKPAHLPPDDLVPKKLRL
ncbi:hypothetical protein ACFW04_013407 [Cataglyphis niger]